VGDKSLKDKNKSQKQHAAKDSLEAKRKRDALAKRGTPRPPTTS
jgi:hypothetical protein